MSFSFFTWPCSCFYLGLFKDSIQRNEAHWVISLHIYHCTLLYLLLWLLSSFVLSYWSPASLSDSHCFTFMFCLLLLNIALSCPIPCFVLSWHKYAHTQMYLNLDSICSKICLCFLEIIQKFYKLLLKLMYHPDVLYLSIYPKDNMPQRY